jgi:hypothetical protein
MQYLDFEVEIGQRLEPRSSLRLPIYPIAVLHSPEGVGEPRGEMTLPLTSQQQELQLAKLQNVLLRAGSGALTQRRIASIDEKPVQELGNTLFGALFSGEIGTCYDFAQRTAEKQGYGLRLKLRIQSPEVAVLPWEFLHDGRGSGNFVALSPETPLVRYVEVPRVISTLRVQPPLKILGVVSTPNDLPTLDVDIERLRLEAALRGLIDAGRVELTWLPGQTWQDLRQAMWGGPWHILHFIGHGDFDPVLDEGVIALADETGGSHMLTATQLSRLLAGQSSLRLAVMNSCDGARGSNHDLFSSTAVTLVSAGIPAVVAMQYEISDDAAIQFGNSFYRAVAHGLPVDAAVTEARIAITMHTSDTAEWGIPVLYMRSSDGRLFDLAPAGAVEPPIANRAAAHPVPTNAPVGGPPIEASTPRAQDRRLRHQLDRKWTEALEHFWTQRWDEATSLLGEIVAEQSDYPGAAAKLDEARRQSRLAQLYTTASEAAETGDWTTAVAKLQALTQIDEGYQDAAVRLEQALRQRDVAELYGEARQVSQAEGWEAVISILERIHALDPGFEDEGRLEAAARTRLAERERQRRLEALLNEGMGKLEAREWSQAVASFEQLELQQPNHRTTRDLLARARGEVERLEVEQRRAARERQVAEHLSAAERAYRSGAWAEAGKYLQQLLVLEPGNAQAAQQLAAVLRQQELAGLYEAAKQLSVAHDWQAVLHKFDEIHALDAAYGDPAELQAAARMGLAEAETLAPVRPAPAPLGPVAPPGGTPLTPSTTGAPPRGAPRTMLAPIAAAVAVVIVGVLIVRGATGNQSAQDSAAVTVTVASTANSVAGLQVTALVPTPVSTLDVAQIATQATATAPAVAATPAVAAPAKVIAPPPSDAPAATITPTIDQSWATTLQAIDGLWGNDWPRTIDILRGFLDTHAGYVPAQDKLYAAHLFYGGDLVNQGNTDEAINQFVSARELFPDRNEAQATLRALTPTPTLVPARAPAPVQPAPRQPVQAPVAPPAPAPKPVVGPTFQRP